MNKFKIVSLNVWGLQNMQKRHNLFTYLKLMGADIYMLQETHATIEDSRLWQTEWGATIIHSYGTTRSSGCCIMFNKNRSSQIHDVCCDVHGHFIIADMSVGNYRLSLINLYGPNADTPLFFESLFKKVISLANQEMIMGGDFNLVMDAA